MKIIGPALSLVLVAINLGNLCYYLFSRRERAWRKADRLFWRRNYISLILGGLRNRETDARTPEDEIVEYSTAIQRRKL